MCNNYRASRLTALDLAQYRVDVVEDDALPAPTAEAWPKSSLPVVLQSSGRRTLARLRWGVWPWYEKTMPVRPIVNARDDALLTKNLWTKLAASRRCLVPADGFFEWCGPAGGRWEVLFELKDRRPFFFAGLWSHDPTGGGRGFTLVTGRPNELVAALPHDRMPVILDDAGATAWLGDRPLPPDRLLALCAPFPAEHMTRTDQPKPDRKPAPAIEAEKVDPGELFQF